MSYHVSQTDWTAGRDQLLAVRYKVFVEEQKVPIEIEVDDMDEKCIHFLACDDAGQPIGTARIDDEGHVGRVAVLEQWRGKGVGRALMKSSLAQIEKDGLSAAHLNSQISAAAFYATLGFVPHGDEFMEAGIPHVAMTKQF